MCHADRVHGMYAFAIPLTRAHACYVAAGMYVALIELRAMWPTLL